MRVMKILVIAVLFLVIAALETQAVDKGKSDPYTVVTSEELNAMLDQQENGLVIIDARNLEEFQVEHIRTAVSLPWPKFEKDRTLLNFPKEAKIVFYCNGFK